MFTELNDPVAVGKHVFIMTRLKNPEQFVIVQVHSGTQYQIVYSFWTKEHMVTRFNELIKRGYV
jgi:hypothetical protein